MTRPYPPLPRLQPIVLALALVAMLAMFAAPAKGAQEPGSWEYHPFAAQSAFDSEDPVALTARSGDRAFERSLDLEDDLYAGLRVGYQWSPQFAAEVSYDRNRSGAEYAQTVRDLFLGTRASTEGRVTATFTSYQLGFLYSPLGSRQTRWQPYLTAGVGWIDVDLERSSAVARASRGVPERVLGVEFPVEDHGLMGGYGLGLKYYLAGNFAIRAEARGKTYELLDRRRNDGEISLGISLFVPGD